MSTTIELRLTNIDVATNLIGKGRRIVHINADANMDFDVMKKGDSILQITQQTDGSTEYRIVVV